MHYYYVIAHVYDVDYFSVDSDLQMMDYGQGSNSLSSGQSPVSTGGSSFPSRNEVPPTAGVHGGLSSPSRSEVPPSAGVHGGLSSPSQSRLPTSKQSDSYQGNVAVTFALY